MTQERKPGPRITWETIERVAAEGDRTRIESMSGAELDEELREAGIDPERAARVAERAMTEGSSSGSSGEPPATKGELPVTKGEPPAPTTDREGAKGSAGSAPAPLRAIGAGAPGQKARAPASRVPRWAPWVGAATLAASALLVLANQHDGGSAGGNRVATPPPDENADDEGLPPPRQAAKLRRRALVACDQEQWSLCETLLDRAKLLDPAGESAPLVIAARRELAHAPRDAH